MIFTSTTHPQRPTTFSLWPLVCVCVCVCAPILLCQCGCYKSSDQGTKALTVHIFQDVKGRGLQQVNEGGEAGAA